jgi:hypothetical protein
MAVCHDARKGRNIGIHWSKPVAPPLHSTSSYETGWPPSYHGTGTEEYFNSGWCKFDRKAVSGYVSVHP